LYRPVGVINIEAQPIDAKQFEFTTDAGRVYTEEKLVPQMRWEWRILHLVDAQQYFFNVRIFDALIARGQISLQMWEPTLL
jgi:hypothetical protein